MKQLKKHKVLSFLLAITLLLSSVFIYQGVSQSLLAEDVEVITLQREDIKLDAGGSCDGFSDQSKAKFSKILEEKEFIELRFDDSLNITEFAAYSGFRYLLLRDKAKIRLVLPKTTKWIKEYAFHETNIVDVVFNEGLKSIEHAAFYDCNIETDLVLPDSILEIGELSFSKNAIKSVKIGDSIQKIGPAAFEDNEIESVDFGNFESVEGVAANNRRYYAPNTMSAKMFCKNKLKSVTIPASVDMVGVQVFEDNPELTTLDLSLVNTRTDGMITFANGAFRNCNLSGKLEFKRTAKFISDSFTNQNITELDFHNNPNHQFQPMSFENNPIEKINNLNFVNYGGGTFRNSNTLKNLNFDLENFNPVAAAKNAIFFGMFNGGKLRAVEIPSSIIFKDDINNPTFTPFLDNVGYYEGISKVALYRKNPDKVTYEMNNVIPDGANYTINPVVVEIKFVDTKGNALQNAPSTIYTKLTRSDSDGEQNYESDDTPLLNATNFKLGDKLGIKVPETVNDGKFNSINGLTELVDGKAEFTLDPNSEFMKTVEYGDGYEVGYKKFDITIVYGLPEPPVPSSTGDSNTTPSQPLTTEPATVPTTVPSSSTETIATTEGATEPIFSNNIDTETTNEATTYPTGTEVPVSTVSTLPSLPPSPIFEILSEEGVPLGKAIIQDNGSLMFIDTEEVPLGKAKLSSDNAFEILEISTERVPLAGLPNTGQSSKAVMYIVGIALILSGVYVSLRK